MLRAGPAKVKGRFRRVSRVLLGEFVTVMISLYLLPLTPMIQPVSPSVFWSRHLAVILISAYSFGGLFGSACGQHISSFFNAICCFWQRAGSALDRDTQGFKVNTVYHKHQTDAVAL